VTRLTPAPRIAGLGNHRLDAIGGKFLQYHGMHGFLLGLSVGGEAPGTVFVRGLPGHAGICRECCRPV
jgi:hypothetical protein